MYEKLSLKSFKKSLEAGKYGSAGGARRAVTKADDLVEAEKNQARKIIDQHFGVAPAAVVVAPKNKPGPKPKALAAKPVIKVEKVKSKPGPKPKTVVKVQAVVSAKPRKAKAEEKAQDSIAPGVETKIFWMSDERNALLKVVELGLPCDKSRLAELQSYITELVNELCGHADQVIAKAEEKKVKGKPGPKPKAQAAPSVSPNQLPLELDIPAAPTNGAGTVLNAAELAASSRPPLCEDLS